MMMMMVMMEKDGEKNGDGDDDGAMALHGRKPTLLTRVSWEICEDGALVIASDVTVKKKWSGGPTDRGDGNTDEEGWCCTG